MECYNVGMFEVLQQRDLSDGCTGSSLVVLQSDLLQCYCLTCDTTYSFVHCRICSLTIAGEREEREEGRREEKRVREKEKRVREKGGIREERERAERKEKREKRDIHYQESEMCGLRGRGGGLDG